MVQIYKVLRVNGTKPRAEYVLYVWFMRSKHRSLKGAQTAAEMIVSQLDYEPISTKWRHTEIIPNYWCVIEQDMVRKHSIRSANDNGKTGKTRK